MASADSWTCKAGKNARDAAGNGAPHTLLQSCLRDGKQVSCKTFSESKN